jgi:hypothetical protein
VAHDYQERVVPSMSAHALRVGEGRISGYLSSTLGVMSFLAVLCFRYPTYLTTTDLRAVYDVDMLRQILHVAMWASLGFGTFTFVRGKRRRMGAVGIAFTLIAFALGGYSVETGPLSQRPLALGLDWICWAWPCCSSSSKRRCRVTANKPSCAPSGSSISATSA